MVPVPVKDALRRFESGEIERVVVGPGEGEMLSRLHEIYPAGCDVTLLAGNYLLSEPIKLPSWTRIQGDWHSRATLLQHHAGHFITNANHSEGNVGIILSDFDLRGDGKHTPKGTGSTWSCGAYFNRASSVLAQRIGGYDIRQTALHFTDGSQIAVLELSVERAGWSAVATTRASHVWLQLTASRLLKKPLAAWLSA